MLHLRRTLFPCLVGLFAGHLPAQGGKVASREDPLAAYREASRVGFAKYLESIQGRRRRYTEPLGLGLFVGCGNGSTLATGDDAEALRGMVDELARHQWQNGSFYDGAPKGPRCRARVQAIGAVGLLEAAAVTPGEAGARAREVGSLAFESLMSQRQDTGAWPTGYGDDDPGDFDATAWGVMAMGAAMRGGIAEVDREQVTASCAWLAKQLEGASIEASQDRAKLGWVLFAHMMAGIDPRKDEVLGPLVEQLVPAEDWSEDMEPWEHAPSFAWIGLAGYQLGGKPWHRWRGYLSQVVDAMHDGPELDTDYRHIGLRVLGLQVYWRYGPLLRRR